MEAIRLPRTSLRRLISMVLVAALVATVMVLAPAAVRASRASAAITLQEDAPYLCGGSGSLSTGQLRVQIPPGAQVTTTVEGSATAVPYPHAPDQPGFYLEFSAELSFFGSSGLETWQNYTDHNTRHSTADRVTISRTATFTNASSSPQYLWASTSESRLIVGSGLTVSATVTFNGGASGPPCLPLTGNEFDVPSSAVRNSCGAQPSDRDPVNVVQGNFWQSWTDLEVAGRGPALAWDRTYSSSRAATDGPVGYGWTASYFMKLTPPSGDMITVSQENGAMVKFAKVFGKWSAPNRVDATLIEETDGTFTFTRLGTEVFKFAADGKLTSIKDLSGNTTTLAYTSGLLSTITDPSGRALTVTWSNGRVSSVAAPQAVLSTGGAPVPVGVTYSYDALGNLQTVTDAAQGVWTFGYTDPLRPHHVTTIREPRHHSLGAAAPVVENHYDAQGRVDWQEDRLDRRATFDYSVAGQTRVTAPTAVGQPAQVVVYEHAGGICTGIVRDPGPNQSRWVFEIDPLTLGRTKVTDPNLNVTTATYDPKGRRTSVTTPHGTVSITYNSLGLPLTIADPVATTTLTYDAGTDRLRTISRPVTPGTTGPAVTTLNYNDPANPGMVTSVVDRRNKTWPMTYDTAGNLVSSTDPTLRETTWTYNSLGWPLTTVAPAGNAAGGTPSQHTTSYSYNRRGEVMTMTDPLLAVTQLNRDESGVVTAVLDPVLTGTERTDFTVDAAGQLTTVTPPGGASTLTTEYWPTGQVKTQRDGALNPTGYTYDAQGRLATVTDPANRVTTYRYDAGGRLASKQQPSGNCVAATKVDCVSYGYNTANDLTSIDYSASGTPDVTFSYDALGRRTGMSDGSAWVWDSLDRLKSFTDSNGTVAYAYSDNGPDPTTITYPGGKAVGRTYDDAGRQVTSTGWWTNGTATYGYDDNSNPTTVNTPATTGVEDTYGYDRANRMTAATLRQGTNVLTNLGYSRDPEGMVKQTTATGVTGAADTYTYTPIDQLATTTVGAYTYDAADNLIGFPDGRKQKFTAANELCYTATTDTAACGSAPTGATKYTYDGRGNRTAIKPDNKVPTTLIYDQADRLTSAKVPTYPDGSGQYHDLSTSNIWLTSGEAWTTTTPTRTYNIAGSNGIPLPASAVESVVLRLHVVGASGFGTLWAYPTGGAPGSTAAMYFDPGDATSSLAVSKLSAAGNVTIRTNANVTVSIELVGWYGNANADGGMTYEAVTPARVYSASQTGGTSSPAVQITGLNNVPATGVSAVAVVAHSLSASAPGFLTVYSGTAVPSTVTLLYDSVGSSALTIVPLQPNGSIKVYSSSGTTPALDVVGYYTDVESGNGNVAHTVSPFFLADTVNHAPAGACNGGTCNKLVANTPVTVQVTGVNGIPNNAAAVAVVLQAIIPSGPGELDAYATGTNYPTTPSTIKFDGDAFISGIAIVPIGTGGTISVRSTVATDLIVQAVGYFDPATATYSYTYSGDGLRKQKTAPGGITTKYVWDRSQPAPELLAEYIDEPSTPNDRWVRYLYGPGGTVTADAKTMDTGGEVIRWYHQDQLGSTTSLTSSTGALLSTFSFTPTGTLANWGGPQANLPAGDTPIRWAGEYRDNETGFVYLRARYYDPVTAQFLTRDPLEAITRSPYAYASNDPINQTDPTGMCPWCVAIGVGIVIGGGIDLGFQMFDNAQQGCGLFDDINWGSVAFWGGVGGLTGGLSHWARAAQAARAAQRVAFRADTSHIFRNAAGHLADDTVANRALLRSAIRPEHFVGTRGPGGSISVYRRLLPDGRQVWVEVRNGQVITNGGVNPVPRP